MSDNDWLSSLTDDERREYEEAMRHTTSAQMSQLSREMNGCLAALLGPIAALLTRLWWRLGV